MNLKTVLKKHSWNVFKESNQNCLIERFIKYFLEIKRLILYVEWPPENLNFSPLKSKVTNSMKL